MIVRAARDDDRGLIAALHAESWRGAYRGAISDAFLDGPIDAEFAARWRDQPVGPDDALLVSEDGAGGILAFCATWKRDATAYIDNFHVAAAARSQGVGRALLAQTARLMQANGCTDAYLHVVTTNARARDLYIRLGGIPGEVTDHLLGGSIVPNQRIDWPDIAVLAERAAQRRA